jgi:hypothetical protein
MQQPTPLDTMNRKTEEPSVRDLDKDILYFSPESDILLTGK